MNRSVSQGQLFSGQSIQSGFNQISDLPLSRNLLHTWQQRLHDHQAPLFQGEALNGKQDSLFGVAEDASIDHLKPLKLTPLPLSFWRWPISPHQGPAVYLVMDRPQHLAHPLLLYVGETGAADRRWKGAHDCKIYLAAYREALGRVELASQLSIRFWTDVPMAIKARRKLERDLIQRWLPPFNKETRGRWTTPFTAELN